MEFCFAILVIMSLSRFPAVRGVSQHNLLSPLLLILVVEA